MPIKLGRCRSNRMGVTRGSKIFGMGAGPRLSLRTGACTNTPLLPHRCKRGRSRSVCAL